jgi:pseudouridine kinase
VYLALMDNRGEMALALNDMQILEKLNAAHLQKKTGRIRKSSIIVIDSNISAQAIHFIASKCADLPLFLDPVSITKAEKVKTCIGSFDTIKLNRIEAAAISGLKIQGIKNLRRAGEWFIEKGVRRVFITLGSEGVFCYSAEECFFHEAPHITVVNVTGSGDAFMAGIVYGSLNGYSNKETARFSSAMSGLTAQSRKTVSEKISLTNIKRLEQNAVH